MIHSDKYSFQVERFADVLPEIEVMLGENHAETGMYDRPFRPDYERYKGLEAMGGLAFMSIRSGGKVVGYASFFLDRHIYQLDIVSATQSLNYVDKGHRGIGYSFMKFCDDSLKKQGVNSVWRQATAKFDISKIYERMGYALIQKSYRKDL